MDDINSELLITLVEERPVIWDKTLDSYKDKNLKESAWKEICVILKENFEEMEQKQRQEFGKLVLKKWTQTRDSWMKSIKKHKEQKKSGSSAKLSRLYLFHEQMLFLNKILDTSVAHESCDNNESTLGDANDEASVEDIRTAEDEEKHGGIPTSGSKTSISGTQRKRKTELKNELDAKMMTFLEHQTNIPKNEDDENRHLSFFKSILPSLSSLNDDETLEFQSGVISLLQSIKRRKQTLSWLLQSAANKFYSASTNDEPSG